MKKGKTLNHHINVTCGRVTQSNHALIFLNKLLPACQENFMSLSVYVRNGKNHSAIVFALRCHSEGAVQGDKVPFFPSEGHFQPACASRQDMFIPQLDKSLPIFFAGEKEGRRRSLAVCPTKAIFPGKIRKSPLTTQHRLLVSVYNKS